MQADDADSRLLALLSPGFRQRYQLGELLGRGGMGIVHKALETSTGRPVAIKFMAGGLFEGDDAEARFFNEASAMEGVDHPNLVQVLDHGKDAGTPFIVFQFVPGRTLKALVRERGRLPVFEALQLARGILAGLKEAHARQIIHRDMKSENVLVGPDGVPRVADFGIAKSDRPQQTKTGVIIGTPAYMAPEQAKGQKLDPRCDVYSAGVVLFEMLTGQLPFGDENSMQTMMAHINEPVPAPSYLVPGLPALLDDLLSGALAKAREGRYPSAGAFAIAIDRSLEKLRQVGFEGVRETPAAPQAGEAAGTRAIHLATSSGQAQDLGAMGSQTRAATTEQLGAVAVGPTAGVATQRVLQSTVAGSASVGIPRKIEAKNPAKLVAALGVGLLVLLAGGVGLWRAMRGGPAVPAGVDPANLEGPEAQRVLGNLEQLAEPELMDSQRRGILGLLGTQVPAGNEDLRQVALRRLEAIRDASPPDEEMERAFLQAFASLGHVASYEGLLEASRGHEDPEERALALRALQQGLARGQVPGAEATEELSRSLWNAIHLAEAGDEERRVFLEAVVALGSVHGVFQLAMRARKSSHELRQAIKHELVEAMIELAVTSRPAASHAATAVQEGIDPKDRNETLDMTDDQRVRAMQLQGRTFKQI